VHVCQPPILRCTFPSLPSHPHSAPPLVVRHREFRGRTPLMEVRHPTAPPSSVVLEGAARSTQGAHGTPPEAACLPIPVAGTSHRAYPQPRLGGVPEPTSALALQPTDTSLSVITLRPQATGVTGPRSGLSPCRNPVSNPPASIPRPQAIKFHLSEGRKRLEQLQVPSGALPLTGGTCHKPPMPRQLTDGPVLFPAGHAGPAALI
jgi:hypothetical protein